MRALRLHDPGLQSLRRAARVAIVVPVIFAIFLNGLDNSVAALFAAFASFALLGFADFGGAPRPRATAYLVLTAVGAALVLVGTLVCNEPLLAALIGVAVGAVVRFAGCFGGYYAAAVSPLILAYVLAASVTGPIDALPDRLLGWVVAGIVSTVAGLVLWPRRERRLIREAAAVAAGATADAVARLADPGGPPRELMAAMDDAIAKLVEAASVPRRPDGPSAHDVALAFLVDQLERVGVRVRDAARRPTVSDAAARLGTVAAEGLRAVAGMLESGRVPDDLDALVGSCVEMKGTVVGHAVDELGSGDDPGVVLEEIDALFTERYVLLIAASALANAAVVVSGRGPSAEAITIPLDVPPTCGRLDRLRVLVGANAVPTSAWAQESLRAGVAVGAAILIAGELRLDHGFWVVLGTLSVLRSNVFNTGRTALIAAVGTAVGFAISAGLLVLVGFDHAGLWVIVVIGFFLSAYTPQVVGFVAGQVCFTIAVVAMFNLIDPQGWQTGLVRVENIAIGSTVSAVVALLFWPSRASVGLRANVSELYRGLSRAIVAGVADPAADESVHATELRAHVSYVEYLSETARAPEGRRPWATLLGEAAQIRFAIGALQHHRGVTRLGDSDPTRRVLVAAAGDVAGALDRTAAHIEHRNAPDDVPVDVSAVTRSTREPVRTCLLEHAHDVGRNGPRAAAVDAAIVRDLIVEAAVLTDHAFATVTDLPDG